ncbi:hypothetical protein PV11_03705 [Exophiala sideris]|uniref:Zinc-binding loop region of homing endonuclease domain-containing protein n=1 Tax=Exophiala sideris TaxID=1016849 RepID=A0A0D1YF56_9EURO|nr:hypothetical protein PV11_03705 [Exophiala sideris]
MSYKINRSKNLGIRVERGTGRIVDFEERPAPVSAPYGSDQSSRRAQKEFRERDDQILREWSEATRTAGLSRGKVYDELSSLRPAHSAQAWESRSRREHQVANSSLSTSQSFDAPFPNLDKIDPLYVPPPGVGPDNLPAALTYSDLRVDIQKSLLNLLALEGEDELIGLITQEWFLAALQEYKQHTTTDLMTVDRENDPLESLRGRSEHAFKISLALDAVQNHGSRFCGEHIDKAAWSLDDHEIRFIVRVAVDAGMSDCVWQDVGPLSEHPRRWETLCYRTFWLLSWVRFIHQVSTAQGRDAERLDSRKKHWLQVIQNARRRGAYREHKTPWYALAAETETAQMAGKEDVPNDSTVLPVPPLIPGPLTTLKSVAIKPDDDESLDAMPDGLDSIDTETGPSPLELLTPPHYTMPASKNKNEEKCASWLLQHTRDVFLNEIDYLLQSYGVTREHRGTCVLIPSDLKRTAPQEILPQLSSMSLPFNDEDDRRLTSSIDGHEVLAARGIAWFYSSWPRRGIDLDQFNSIKEKGPYVDMQGSHLCSQAFCILPGHIEWESRLKNMSRNKCQNFAKNLRSYGSQIPKHCIHHDPPCLMQHAALTAYEAFCIQMSLFCVANDLEVPELPRPTDHSFPTFETRLPLSMPCCETALQADPEALVAASNNSATTAEKLLFTCALSCSSRRWIQITSYWAHLISDHATNAEDKVIEEIQCSARRYKEFAESRHYDNSIRKTATWTKIEQALAGNFTIEVVKSWRLEKSTVYSGRQGHRA